MTTRDELDVEPQALTRDHLHDDVRGINASLALLAADALRAYLSGKKAEAAEDFATVAEEIRGRLAASAEDAGSQGEPSRSNGRR